MKVFQLQVHLTLVQSNLIELYCHMNNKNLTLLYVVLLKACFCTQGAVQKADVIFDISGPFQINNFAGSDFTVDYFKACIQNKKQSDIYFYASEDLTTISPEMVRDHNPNARDGLGAWGVGIGNSFHDLLTPVQAQSKDTFRFYYNLQQNVDTLIFYFSYFEDQVGKDKRSAQVKYAVNGIGEITKVNQKLSE